PATASGSLCKTCWNCWSDSASTSCSTSCWTLPPLPLSDGSKSMSTEVVPSLLVSVMVPPPLAFGTNTTDGEPSDPPPGCSVGQVLVNGITLPSEQIWV